MNFERANQKSLCLIKRPLPAIKISQVEQGDRVVRSLTERLLEVPHCFIWLSLLGRDHTKIVPCLWIIRAQLQCLFNILTRLLKIISSQVERAQVVIGFRIIRFLSDDLLEGGGRRVEVAMLEERHPVGEVIALERIVIEHPTERKRFLYAIGCGGSG